jgi:hypothetical protein
MLAPFLDPSDAAFPSGRPVVFVTGLVFLLAGVAIMIPEWAGGRDASIAHAVVIATLLSAFAAVPALIALHEGALPPLGAAAFVGILATWAWDHVLKRWLPRAAIRLALYAALLLAAVVVARRDPVLEAKLASPQAPAPTFEPVALELQRHSVVAGGTVRVTFDPPIAMPPGYHYWICIVPKGAEVARQGLRSDLAPGASAIDLTAPDMPGDYEVRLHPHYNAVIAMRPLVVRSPGREEPRPEVEAR